MKITLGLFLIIITGCSSDTPVNVDEVLIEKTNGRFMKLTNQKVYSGPVFKLYKSGEKREEGNIKNGWKTDVWTGYYKNGSKKFVGEYKNGKEDGKWMGYYRSGEKKYEGKYFKGFQVDLWNYYNKSGKKTLEENYFTCDEPCEEPHLLGKIIDEKKF